jgi:SAM-dependent methyltransferase
MTGPRGIGGLRWPLPALAVWGLAWAGYLALRDGAPLAAWAVAAGLGMAALPLAGSPVRAAWLAAGFPASWAALQFAGQVPQWVWLLALAVPLALYPLRAWRDAPFYPTPARALDGLARALALGPGPARLLDAGCGIGHGLAALHAQFPRARLEGVEWSRWLALLARSRCRFATVHRGDMWSLPWRDFDLVYLFQRPETMPRAWAKAAAEMPPGSWLVSLEFPVPGVRPSATFAHEGCARVFAYRMEGRPRPAVRAQPR